MRASDLTYPLLCLTRELGPCLVEDPAALERCPGAVYWRARFYEGLRLVDPEGRTYAVTRATVRKPASPFARRLARVLDLPVSVELDAAPADPLPLAELVRIVERAVDEDAETFEEFSGREVDWWRRELAKARSVADVVAAFGAREGKR